ADHSTTGSWAVIDGIGKHRGDYHASFLYDLRDNRVIRIPPLRQGAAVEFSADDRTLAFVSRPERAQIGELHVAKVGSVAVHPVATGIRATGNYALSDDGSRAAIATVNLITIYDLATLSSLGSVRAPDGRMIVPKFVSNDRLRIYAHGNGTQIFEYDVAKK